MCLAMPMKIDQIDGTLARCEAGGLSQNIRVDFITDPKPCLLYTSDAADE